MIYKASKSIRTHYKTKHITFRTDNLSDYRAALVLDRKFSAVPDSLVKRIAGRALRFAWSKGKDYIQATSVPSRRTRTVTIPIHPIQQGASNMSKKASALDKIAKGKQPARAGKHQTAGIADASWKVVGGTEIAITYQGVTKEANVKTKANLDLLQSYSQSALNALAQSVLDGKQAERVIAGNKSANTKAAKVAATNGGNGAPKAPPIDNGIVDELRHEFQSALSAQNDMLEQMRDLILEHVTTPTTTTPAIEPDETPHKAYGKPQDSKPPLPVYSPNHQFANGDKQPMFNIPRPDEGKAFNISPGKLLAILAHYELLAELLDANGYLD